MATRRPTKRIRNRRYMALPHLLLRDAAILIKCPSNYKQILTLDSSVKLTHLWSLIYYD
jgi:hypothetical protein